MTEERWGLYYPYVHFRDETWLKKTLLVFPGLVRMVSPDQVPDDSDLVNQLRHHKVPLIREADLATVNARSAQEHLQRLFSEDLAENEVGLLARFGEIATLTSGLPSFQMNLGKAGSELAAFLRRSNLAWGPQCPEAPEYSELHPDVGNAVMGALAIACARDAGLHIVGSHDDKVSPTLNQLMLLRDLEAPYNHFVRGALPPETSHRPDADTLFQLVVRLNCDVSKLDVNGLQALHNEREAFLKLKEQLEKVAASIPAMEDHKQREERWRATADRIVTDWERDRLNLSNVVREAAGLEKFGSGAKSLAETLYEKVLPFTTGAAATFLPVIGTSGGLLIGLVTHLGASYVRARGAALSSPYHYMTMAKERGALFSLSSSLRTVETHRPSDTAVT